MNYQDLEKCPRETVDYKHVFTHEELLRNAEELSQAQFKKTELEDDKKALMSSYKDKIDSQQSRINELSRKGIAKFEIKPVWAYKFKDKERKLWAFLHPDTLEEIYTTPWSAKDYQLDAFEDQETAINSNKVEENPDPFGIVAVKPVFDDTEVTAVFTDADGKQTTAKLSLPKAGNLTFGGDLSDVPQPVQPDAEKEPKRQKNGRFVKKDSQVKEAVEE